jgi:hypothetical protein
MVTEATRRDFRDVIEKSRYIIAESARDFDPTWTDASMLLVRTHDG